MPSGGQVPLFSLHSEKVVPSRPPRFKTLHSIASRTLSFPCSCHENDSLNLPLIRLCVGPAHLARRRRSHKVPMLLLEQRLVALLSHFLQRTICKLLFMREETTHLVQQLWPLDTDKVRPTLVRDRLSQQCLSTSRRAPE
jgi:hypothetical protein